MTSSYRLSLLAVVSCLVISACGESGSPTATPAQDVAPVSNVDEPDARPVVDQGSLLGPATLTEIDEAARNAEFPASGSCNFDRINGEPISDVESVRVQDPTNFSISGWVVDKAEMARPQAVLRLKETNEGRGWEIGVGPGTDRLDVARHLNNDGLRNAGFEVKADLGGLPPGEYSLSLIHQSGARRVACDKGKKIVVGG